MEKLSFKKPKIYILKTVYPLHPKIMPILPYIDPPPKIVPLLILILL